MKPTIQEVREALSGLLDHYTQLVNSGDAGNWNPEKEPQVIAARRALASLEGYVLVPKRYAQHLRGCSAGADVITGDCPCGLFAALDGSGA
jgi:hypothetical protein